MGYMQYCTYIFDLHIAKNEVSTSGYQIFELTSFVAKHVF